MVKILQWNIAGARNKMASLISTVKTEDHDIILLQETLYRNAANIPGYKVFSTPFENGKRGLAIYCKNSIPAIQLHRPIPCGDVECMAIQITLQETKLDIYNIYRRPTRDRPENNLELDQLFAHMSSNPTIAGGDFNAHHTVLNSTSRTCDNGRHITMLLEEMEEIVLLNDGQPTHVRGGRLDLTFISKCLKEQSTWGIHPELVSDHFAVFTKLELEQLPPIPPPPPRWNQDTADWDSFRGHLETWKSNYEPPEDTDRLEDDLVKALHQAANASMTKKVPGNYTFKDSWYYCPEVRALKTRLNRTRKLFRRRRTEENLELLQVVAGHVNEELSKIRRNKWLEWCARISQHSTISEIWKWLKMVAGKKTKKIATHPAPEQEAERLANKFAQRSSTIQLPPDTQIKQQELRHQRWREINEACYKTDDTDRPYTIEELHRTYKKSKDTAPGADLITYTMIKNMGSAGEDALLHLINTTHTKHTRPKAWNQQDIQPIPKPKDPENPRPISLASCLEKTAERMALNRLQYKTGPLHPKLYAYRKGIGTTECIMDLLSCINNKRATIAFLDYEKAFELANPVAVLHSLVRKGIKGHLLAWNKNYLLNRQARVKFQGKISEYKDLENGTPQGGILSPYLFNLLMENIATIQLPNGVDLFIFADDVAVVSRGPIKTVNLQRALNQIHKKSAEIGLKINSNKTKAMVIKDHTPDHPLTIGGRPIEWVETFMYLGVYIDTNLTFNKQVGYLRDRAKARLAPMRYMTSLSEGTNYQVQRSYYTACTRTLVDYAAPTLCNLKEKQTTKLEVIQNNAMRLILGAPMWTRLSNLNLETNLPPLEARISARNTHIITKTLLNRQDSIAARRVKEALGRHPELPIPDTYGSHLASSIKRMELEKQTKEIKSDTPTIPYNPPPWNKDTTIFNYTKLPMSKRECTPEALKAAALLAIEQTETQGCHPYYTDGTVDPDTSTTGAAVIAADFSACWRTSDTCSTMQTELVAIAKALQHSLDNHSSAVVIHTDCKSAMQVLQQNQIKENQKLISNVKSLLYQHKQENRKVTLNWIPSHIGIPGNEKVDTLAKQTKYINQVQITVQPSLSQLKHNTRIQSRNIMIENANRHIQQGSYTAEWYKRVSEHNPYPMDKQIPRQLSTTIHRLRLGYKANWQIINPEPRNCKHCDELTDAPLLHYLLKCQETRTLRNNTNTPQDIYSREAKLAAADIAKNITENIEQHCELLLSHPPPR